MTEREILVKLVTIMLMERGGEQVVSFQLLANLPQYDLLFFGDLETNTLMAYLRPKSELVGRVDNDEITVLL